MFLCFQQSLAVVDGEQHIFLEEMSKNPGNTQYVTIVSESPLADNARDRCCCNTHVEVGFAFFLPDIAKKAVLMTVVLKTLISWASRLGQELLPSLE